MKFTLIHVSKALLTNFLFLLKMQYMGKFACLIPRFFGIYSLIIFYFEIKVGYKNLLNFILSKNSALTL